MNRMSKVRTIMVEKRRRDNLACIRSRYTWVDFSINPSQGSEYRLKREPGTADGGLRIERGLKAEERGAAELGKCGSCRLKLCGYVASADVLKDRVLK